MRWFIFSLIAITFFSCNKEEDSELLNKWKVEGYVKDSFSLSQTASSDLYITFNKNKSVELSLEINRCGGNFSLDEKTITISNFSCTEACCDSEFSMELLDLLSQINTYSISGNQLTLTGDDQLKIRLNIAN